MEARKKLTIPIDLKLNSMIPLPQFIQNDTNILEFTVKDNGVDADLSNITRIVINYKRLDKKVISRLLTATGNTILYEIGLEEMEVPGPGEMELQFFENEDRISTKRFKVNMLASIGTDAIYENTEQLTVLQELFVEVDTVKAETETARQNADAATEAANTAAANAQLVADENKTKFLPAVATVADRDTTYTSPAHGDTVRVTGESKTYRFDSVSGWVVTDQYNPTAIDQLNADLAEKAAYTYVDNEIAKKMSGAPKGVYTYLADLQNAYPTGNASNYIVAGNVAEVANLNITAAPTASGNVTVTLNGVAKTVAVTSGVVEVASLTISAIPTTAGNVTVTLNGVATNIAVDPAIDTTTDAVAIKIRNTVFTGWTTGGTGSTVTFTASSVGVKTDGSYNAGTTGATGTMSTTTQGVDADTVTSVATKIRATTFTGWTTGGTGSTVTFTATSTGIKTDSTYNAGSTGAGGTMSTTTQGADPDGKWYYWNGTAWTAGGLYQATELAPNSVTKEKLVNDAVTHLKTDFLDYQLETFKPVDIYNPNALSPQGEWCSPTTGAFQSTAGTTQYLHTDYLPARPSIRYISSINLSVVFFDKNKTYISGLSSLTSMTVNGISGYGFTTPVNCAYIVKNVNISSYYYDHLYMVEEDLQDPTQYRLDMPKLNLNSFHLLKGKKGVCFGDSVTEFGTYPEQIGQLTGADVKNVGFGGTRLVSYTYAGNYDALGMANLATAIRDNVWTSQDASATAIGGKFPTILQRLKDINWSEIDFVTMLFGTNDFTSGYVTIGEKNSTDIKQINGALNHVLGILLTKYPHLKIYLLTPIYRKTIPNRTGDSDTEMSGAEGNTLYLYDIANAIETKAKEYHVPCKNLYYTSNINKFTQVTYLTNDGVHPNATGFSLLANKISKFLLSN